MKTIGRFLLCMTALLATVNMDGAEQFVSFAGEGVLLNGDGPVKIYAGGDADKGVMRAVGDLCTDLGKVTGTAGTVTGDRQEARIVVATDMAMKARGGAPSTASTSYRASWACRPGTTGPTCR